MRSKGNHIKLGSVLIALMVFNLLLILLALQYNSKDGLVSYDYDTPMTKEFFGLNVPFEESIGPQYSPGKEKMVVQYNEQMKRFLDFSDVE